MSPFTVEKPILSIDVFYFEQEKKVDQSDKQAKLKTEKIPKPCWTIKVRWIDRFQLILVRHYFADLSLSQ
jgi:hypothetical protein